MKNRDLILHHIRLSEVKAIHIHDPTRLLIVFPMRNEAAEGAKRGSPALDPHSPAPTGPQWPPRGGHWGRSLGGERMLWVPSCGGWGAGAHPGAAEAPFAVLPPFSRPED